MVSPFFILLVYLEGILACFSPCGLAVIPTYLGYLAGFEDKPGRALIAGLIFTLGFALINAFIGALAGAIGLILPPIEITYAVLGIIMIACGIFFLVYIQRYVCKYQPLNRFSRFSGFFGALILGLSFGFIGVACTTPIIAGVFILITTLQNIPLGAILLFLFGIGYGTPLIIISPLLAKGHNIMGGRFETASRWLSRLAGILLLVLGIDLLLPLFGFHTIIFRFLTGGTGP